MTRTFNTFLYALSVVTSVYSIPEATYLPVKYRRKITMDINRALTTDISK